MCSGSHQAQVDTFPSSVHTILEGVSKCNPAVPIRPCILKVELRLHIHVTNVERLRCTPLFSNLPKFDSTLYARYLQPVLISTYGYGRTKMACHIIRGGLIEYRQIRARVNIARSQSELRLNNPWARENWSNQVKYLISWECSASFIDQSQRVVEQNQDSPGSLSTFGWKIVSWECDFS